MTIENENQPVVAETGNPDLAAENALIVKKNQELLEEIRSLKTKFKEVDLSEYSTLRTERAEQEARARQAEEEAARKAGDFTKLEERLKADKDAAVKAKEARIALLEANLNKRLVDAELSQALAAEKAVVPLLLPVMKSRVKVEEIDGDFTAVVLDPSGQRMYRPDGTPAAMQDLIQEYKANELYGRCFESPMANGSNTRSVTSNPLVGVSNPWSKDNWNVTEQMRMLKVNPDQAAALKAQATA